VVGGAAVVRGAAVAGGAAVAVVAGAVEVVVLSVVVGAVVAVVEVGVEMADVVGAGVTGVVVPADVSGSVVADGSWVVPGVPSVVATVSSELLSSTPHEVTTSVRTPSALVNTAVALDLPVVSGAVVAVGRRAMAAPSHGFP
jgi:hypothetical protein